VFEVLITLEVSDTTLRPGMTTSNAIEAMVIPNALLVPLEAVASEGETPYVYKRVGGRTVRQQIETGALNDEEIIVLRGLEEGDEIFLSIPSQTEGIETVALSPATPETRADSVQPVTLPAPTSPTTAPAPAPAPAPTPSGR
jgi:multidrug efflux pump subunit AcrA (membrane-fusion protein)